MREKDQPPNEGEEQPAGDERHHEHQQVPPPFHVQHGREDVRQVALAPLFDLGIGQVVLPALVHQSAVLFSSSPPLHTHSSVKRCTPRFIIS